MTPTEIAEVARDIAGTKQAAWPKTVVFRRIDALQRRVFRRAAAIDSEFYGACGTASIPREGVVAVDLAAAFAAGDVGQVDVVRVKDVGDYTPNVRTSPDAHDYDLRVEEGDKITICPAFGIEDHLAPRATLRDGVLQPVGTDFGEEGRRFASIEVFYQRLPKAIDAAGRIDGNESNEVDLVTPWDMLLVYPIAKFLIMTSGDAEVQRVAAAVDEQMDVLNKQFEEHVAQWGGVARSSRFGSV